MLRLNPYRIGFRTIKTAVGMALGVIVAKALGLDNFASSAILVVLCIKHTKVHSVQAIISRFVSCIMILILGSIIFQLLGQHAIVLGLIVLLFIPLAVMFNVQEGVVTSCVILLHVFNAKTIDLDLFINEVLLLIVGLGIAFLMNIIMPSLDGSLDEYKEQVERQITQVFKAFHHYCQEYNKELNLDPLFKRIESTVSSAKSLAFRDVKNHFVRNENAYYYYFDMRETQLELLQRMQNLLQQIQTNDEILDQIAELFEEVSNNVNSNDYTILRLHSLCEIRLELDELPLPETHDALLTRASIIQLLNELEEYLNIKSQFGSLKMHHDVKAS